MRKIPNLIILIGLPGSGKSTFCQQRFSQTHLRISLDMLKTRNREMRILEACLDTDQSVVIDNTNVKRSDRERYIRIGREKKFNIEGYFINTPVDLCLAQNGNRPIGERVPQAAIFAKKKELAVPEMGEGFDSLFLVSIDRNDSFLVEPWK